MSKNHLEGISVWLCISSDCGCFDIYAVYDNKEQAVAWLTANPEDESKSWHPKIHQKTLNKFYHNGLYSDV